MHTCACVPPHPQNQHISQHVPVPQSDEKARPSVLHLVMHVDLIMIKTLSSPLQHEKLQPHAMTGFKYLGSTFLIGQLCQMAKHPGSFLNNCNADIASGQ